MQKSGEREKDADDRKRMPSLSPHSSFSSRPLLGRQSERDGESEKSEEDKVKTAQIKNGAVQLTEN